VKKSARVIIEKYYSRLTLDFQTNKRICDEVAIIPSKRLRNKIAGFVTVRLVLRVGAGVEQPTGSRVSYCGCFAASDAYRASTVSVHRVAFRPGLAWCADVDGVVVGESLVSSVSSDLVACLFL